MNTITVDCGASFVKGALFKDREKCKTISKKAPGYSKSPLNGVCHILQLREIIRDLIVELSEEKGDYRLCISNEMHGFILTDDNSNPITDYISWQIDLGDEKLRQSKEIEECIKKSGMPLRGSLPSCNLSYLVTCGYLQEYSNIMFYTLGDYIIKYLSSSEPFASRSNAAATGLYDIVSDSWNDELIHFIGAEKITFPTISSRDFCFEIDEHVYHVYPAIGDQQAALLGAGLTDQDILSFNLGTGAQVSRITDKISISPLWQIRPFFNNKYLITVPHVPSGRALNVYVRFIRSILDTYGFEYTDEIIWRGIMDAVNKQKDSELKIDMGFFENAVNSSIKGSIEDIDEFDFSMEALFGAVIKQLADNCCMVADRIVPDKKDITKILFSGGIANKFDVVRKRIEEYFPNNIVLNAKGDTLEGLCIYGEMMADENMKG